MRHASGTVLTIAGLAAVVACLAATAHYPDLPVGVFVAAAFLTGVPPILIGIRMASRALRPGLSPSEFEVEHGRQTLEVAVTLGFSAALSLPLAAPVVLMGVGLLAWDKGVLAAWGLTWVAVVRFGCRPILRPIHDRLQRAAVRWYDRGAAELRSTAGGGSR